MIALVNRVWTGVVSDIPLLKATCLFFCLCSHATCRILGPPCIFACNAQQVQYVCVYALLYLMEEVGKSVDFQLVISTHMGQFQPLGSAQ